MKDLVSICLIILSLSLFSCRHRQQVDPQVAYADSLRVAGEHNYKQHLAELQKLREQFTGPVKEGDPTISKGGKFATSYLDDSLKQVTKDFDKFKAKIARAEKDSTSPYGGLFTRFMLQDSLHRYLTGTYTSQAHILRFTSYDDKHIEDKDLYFSNGQLIYFHRRFNFVEEEQAHVTDDCYFLTNNKVVYAFRDEGIATERKDKMTLVIPQRYALKGDFDAYISKEFANFKNDYEILLSQPLEPLVYSWENRNQ